ncbi:MAG TPA: hypothetical protein VGC41_10815, partial [Kofleriaceae bacterium]
MTVFESRLALAFHQVVRARALAEQMTDLVESSQDEIARLRASPTESTAMARLAARLGLTDDQTELVWAIVACSIDGRLLSHLESLGGGHARRGLSIAVYTQFAELGTEVAAQLAQWLAA